MSERDTIRSVVGHLALATQPLVAGFRDTDAFHTLMLRLGWDVQSLPASYGAVADAAAQLVDAAKALADDAGLDESLALARSTGDLYRAVAALTAAPPGMDPAALATLARDLFELLLVDHLNIQLPRLASTLELIGVIRYETIEAAGTRPAFTRTRFEWEALPKVLTDPTTIPSVVLGWGTPQFDFSRAAVLFGELGYALNLATALDRMDADFARAVQSQATGTPATELRRALRLAFFDFAVAGQVQDIGILVTELPAEGSALPGVLILPLVPDHIDAAIPVDSHWTFKLRAGTDLTKQLGVVFRPGELSVRYPFAPGQPPPSAGFGVTLSFTPDSPTLLLGSPGGIRAELAGMDLTLAFDVRGGDLELKAAVVPRGLVVVLTGAGIDGFLGSLLGDQESRIELSTGVSWSSRTGFDFRRSRSRTVRQPAPRPRPGAVRLGDLVTKFVAGSGSRGARPPGRRDVLRLAWPVAFSVDRIGCTSRTVRAGQRRAVRGRFRAPRTRRHRALGVIRPGHRWRVPVLRRGQATVRRRPAAGVREAHAQRDRPAHHAHARRIKRLLAARHRAGIWIHAHPARLRFHAQRGRRPARHQPHRVRRRAAGRGEEPHPRRDPVLAGRPDAPRAADHLHAPDRLPARGQPVRLRAHGADRLGHADAAHHRDRADPRATVADPADRPGSGTGGAAGPRPPDREHQPRRRGRHRLRQA
jgi:hypothetical protein